MSLLCLCIVGALVLKRHWVVAGVPSWEESRTKGGGGSGYAHVFDTRVLLIEFADWVLSITQSFFSYDNSGSITKTSTLLSWYFAIDVSLMCINMHKRAYASSLFVCWCISCAAACVQCQWQFEHCNPLKKCGKFYRDSICPFLHVVIL